MLLIRIFFKSSEKQLGICGQNIYIYRVSLRTAKATRREKEGLLETEKTRYPRLNFTMCEPILSKYFSANLTLLLLTKIVLTP